MTSKETGVHGDKRTFDLTAGPTKIDCSHHCPASELGEEYAHFEYKKGLTTSFEFGPFCAHPKAPFSYESKPRNVLSKILKPKVRRKCVYWNEINS